MSSKLLNAKTLDKHPTIRRLTWRNDQGKEEYLLYHLKRHAFSKRMTLRWTPGGAVVTAPLWVALRPIDSFVFDRRDWLAERAAITHAREEKEDGTVAFRGGRARLRFNARETHFERSSEGEWELHLGIAEDELHERRRAEIGFALRVEARRVLKERYEIVQSRVLEKASHWRLSNARGRWGSCNPRLRTLNFSWRLVGCGDDLIDYVVAHELAHLREANHSKAFWAEVEKIDPLYREHERLIKEIRVDDLFPGL